LFNFKWGIIPGGGAFLISLILGGFSGVAFGYVLLRAGIFFAVFFGFGVGANILITTYLPELLSPDSFGGNEPQRSGSEARPGSRINITLGGPAALPELSQGSGGSDEVGDIADLMSAAASPAPAPQGMDQTPQDGYTNGGGGAPPLADFSQDTLGFADKSGSGGGVSSGGAPGGSTDAFQPAPAYSGPVFTASVDEGDLGALPDLDAMAGAFLTNADEESSAEPVIEQSLMPAGKPARGKSQSLDGDFNPKELAAGIRTVLEKEKKG
jgi:hypothetical protein